MKPQPDWSDGDDQEEGGGLDARALIDFASFGLQSLSRHRHVAVGIIVGALAMGAVGSAVVAKQWSVDIRILTERSLIIPTLVKPGRSLPQSNEPIRGAAEIILSNSFLEELSRRADLRRRWQETLPPISRFRSWLSNLSGGETPNDKLVEEVLVMILSKKIEPSVHDRVLNITVTWNDPDVAYVLAEHTLALFLETQQENELAQIDDTVQILQTSITRATEKLNEAADRLETLIQEKEADATRRLGSRSRTRSRVMSFRRPTADDAENPNTGLMRQLEEKRRLARRLSDDYARRAERANQTLLRLSENLGPNHPDLKEARRQVENLANPPAELARLNADVAQLSRKAEVSQVSTPGRFDVVQMPLSEDVYAALSNDPEIESLMSELAKYVTNYNDLSDRLDNARMEIDMSKAAFAYQYQVTVPPVFPKDPSRRRNKIIWAGCIFIAMFGALGMSLLLDVWSRRIYAPWQVERFLGVEVIGDLHDV